MSSNNAKTAKFWVTEIDAAHGTLRNALVEFLGWGEHIQEEKGEAAAQNELLWSLFVGEGSAVRAKAVFSKTLHQLSSSFIKISMKKPSAEERLTTEELLCQTMNQLTHFQSNARKYLNESNEIIQNFTWKEEKDYSAEEQAAMHTHELAASGLRKLEYFLETLEQVHSQFRQEYGLKIYERGL